MESLLIKNWIYLLTQNMLGSCCTYWKMSNIIGIKILKIIFGSYLFHHRGYYYVLRPNKAKKRGQDFGIINHFNIPLLAGFIIILSCVHTYIWLATFLILQFDVLLALISPENIPNFAVVVI